MERELSMANGGSLWGCSRREGRGGEAHSHGNHSREMQASCVAISDCYSLLANKHPHHCSPPPLSPC